MASFDGSLNLVSALAMSMPDLFRREAIEFQRQKFHGAIVLTRSPLQAVCTTFLLLLVMAMCALAATQGFTRKETVSGLILPSSGVLQLVAPQAGVVLAIDVPQGQQLAQDQVVLHLSSERLSAQGPTLQTIAQSLRHRRSALHSELAQQRRQVKLQEAALNERIASLTAGIARQEQELALELQRLELMQDIASRFPGLVSSGAVSATEASEKLAEVLAQRVRTSRLEREGLASRQELAGAQAQLATLPLQAAREASQLERELQALAPQQAENEAHRELAVLAPKAGELATLWVEPGQAVAAGQVLATLLPAGVALEAELHVPTSAAGFVQPGTPVWLRVDAFPYARYGQLPGRVREVSGSTVPPSEAAAPAARDPLLDRTGGYRVRVCMDEPIGADTQAWRHSLKAGMHVQASLMAERRSLIEWAFEPWAALRETAR